MGMFEAKCKNYTEIQSIYKYGIQYTSKRVFYVTCLGVTIPNYVVIKNIIYYF